MTINEKVDALRQWMRQHPAHPNVYIVPTTDPHASEYIAPHWACREWLTGFTGSAGIAVVTQTDALLWTDSRYWLQAEEQLKGTPFKLMKEGQDPEIDTWMCQAPILRAEGVHAGVAAELLDACTMNTLMNYDNSLFDDPQSHTLVTRDDAFDELWTDRPALPHGAIDVQDEATAGETAKSKLKRLAFELSKKDSCQDDIFFFNSLDDIAWVLNLRGNDIAYNPVFLAFMTYSRVLECYTLYAHTDALTPAARQHLEKLNVGVIDYEDKENLSFALRDPRTRFTHNAPAGLIPTTNYREFYNPIPDWRAIKNESESEGFRQAMRYDGVAMVKFLRWLDESIQKGEPISELSAAQHLTACRADCQHFEGDSFATIAAYDQHGAIVHYEPNELSDVPLQQRGLFLLDSGGQYDCGTTDITRTIALGPLTDEERHINTLVMKGHLRLANLHFPQGTTGLQLDLAARMDMWAEGYDFGHGTGHGVGAHLCVHEGPQQIRKDDRACTRVVFKPGMTITDEPGIYIEGKFGVRIENTLLCVPDRTTDFGTFLRFEVLTLCPYDIRALDLSLLSSAEVEQINTYHHTVREQIMPLLTDEADKLWLARATASIDQEMGE